MKRSTIYDILFASGIITILAGSRMWFPLSTLDIYKFLSPIGAILIVAGFFVMLFGFVMTIQKDKEKIGMKE